MKRTAKIYPFENTSDTTLHGPNHSHDGIGSPHERYVHPFRNTFGYPMGLLFLAHVFSAAVHMYSRLPWYLYILVQVEIQIVRVFILVRPGLQCFEIATLVDRINAAESWVRQALHRLEQRVKAMGDVAPWVVLLASVE